MLHNYLDFIKLVLNFKSLDSSELLSVISSCNLNPVDVYNQCIELFLQINFTGPSDEDIESLLNSNNEIIHLINEDLTCEGEIPFIKTKGIILLWVAKLVTLKMREMKQEVYKSCLGYMKCIYLHQATLHDERSAILKFQMQDCYNDALEVKKNDLESIHPIDELQFLLLSSHLHMKFYEYQKSEEIFNEIQNLLGISTELRGALGKRTKFQCNNVSQLYFSLTRKPSETAEKINDILEGIRGKNLPNDQMIDDEVLLDETEFLQIDDIEKPSQIKPTLAEQASLILQSSIHKLKRARDEMTMEECAAILAYALGNNASRSSTWSLITDALLQRCELPTVSSRRTERSLMQMEEISTQFSHKLPNAESRINWFFLSRLPSIWEIQLKFGRVLIAMGLTKSALDVLLPWQQWPAIIDCLIRLGERGRAERIIREQIQDVGETAELLCCLGDVTKDRVHYEQAWTVSKGKSARAMRSLAGHFMLVDFDHTNAVRCFEQSLSISPLQVNTWFTYGCCCLQLKEYRKAVSAFKQSLRLEPDNYEAWNNCASAMVELDDKKSALALLKEALKYNYENWRVWDNICIVSAQVGEFLTTIKAYHRVMDLKETHRDPSTLAVMVKSVVSGGNEQVRSKLKELFARISSKDGRDPRIWMVYSELLANDQDHSDEMKQRVLQCLSRAHHGMCSSGWEHDKVQRKRVILLALQLVEKSFEYNINYTSAKLAVKSVKTIMENMINSQIEQLDDEVQNLLKKIDEANSQLAEKN